MEDIIVGLFGILGSYVLWLVYGRKTHKSFIAFYKESPNKSEFLGITVLIVIGVIIYLLISMLI